MVHYEAGYSVWPPLDRGISRFLAAGMPTCTPAFHLGPHAPNATVQKIVA
jgi:hypothetical protein